MLCWVMGRCSCSGYACRHDQPPRPWLLFGNALFEIKKWAKIIDLMDIGDTFLLLSPLIKGLYKDSHKVCGPFWDVKSEIYISGKIPKANSHKTVSQFTPQP